MAAHRPGGKVRRRRDAAERAEARRAEDRALTERLRPLAARGRTAFRIAVELGTYRSRIVALAAAAGIVIRPGARPRLDLPDPDPPGDLTTADRRAFAQARFDEGHTLASIGRVLGVSKQRAEQLVYGRQD